MNLNHITISVSDIQRSIDFYKTLGLHLLVRADHYCRFIIPGNNATFSLHLSHDIQPGSTVIYVENEKLETVVQFLKDSGIIFEQEPKGEPWLWREAYLRDPDGHRICLYYAGESRLNPPQAGE
ncbi:MAG TPA: VOC family protein [Chitinophagaceae bacterium]